MAQITRRPVPVLIGSDYEHVMGQAVIVECDGETTISIVAKGEEGRRLAAYVTADVPIAVSFAGIPVQPRITNPHI